MSPEDGKIYKIKNWETGKLMEVEGDKCGNGTQVRQWEDNNRPNKHWKFFKEGDYWKLSPMSCSDHMVLEVDGGCGKGKNARLWEWDRNTTNKLWDFVAQSNGRFKIKLKGCNYVLEVDGGKPDNGRNIRLWEDETSHSGNKLWTLEEVV